MTVDGRFLWTRFVPDEEKNYGIERIGSNANVESFKKMIELLSVDILRRGHCITRLTWYLGETESRARQAMEAAFAEDPDT